MTPGARLPGVVSLEDFDRYCEEHDVYPGQYGVAFAQWLANLTGRPVTAEPADGQGPTVAAEPGETGEG
jgi:hypothetical protein